MYIKSMAANAKTYKNFQSVFLKIMISLSSFISNSFFFPEVSKVEVKDLLNFGYYTINFCRSLLFCLYLILY